MGEMNRTRGFSLTELVVVMVIAGIFAAIAIPRFTDSESRANWYGEQVKAGVRYAQRQAVAQRRNVFVEQITPGQVALCYAAGCAGGTRLTQLTTGQDYILTAPTGVAIVEQTGALPLSFNGLGRPNQALVLNIAGSTITVNAETGYVQ